eukprot:SAG31_NODE_22787_length_518_cov_0.489260_1_plen_71_part_10
MQQSPTQQRRQTGGARWHAPVVQVVVTKVYPVLQLAHVLPPGVAQAALPVAPVPCWHPVHEFTAAPQPPRR